MKVEYTVEMHFQGRKSKVEELSDDEKRSFYGAKVGFEMGVLIMKRLYMQGFKSEEIKLIN